MKTLWVILDSIFHATEWQRYDSPGSYDPMPLPPPPPAKSK